MSHEWIGEFRFVAHDTELNMLLQDAKIRKFLSDEGLEHYALFALIKNPDATAIQTEFFSRLMLSENDNGYGEGIYANSLVRALIEHIKKLNKQHEE